MYLLTIETASGKARLMFTDKDMWTAVGKELHIAIDRQHTWITLRAQGVAHTVKISEITSVMLVDCAEDEKAVTAYNVFLHNLEHRLHKAIADGCTNGEEPGDENYDFGASDVRH